VDVSLCLCVPPNSFCPLMSVCCPGPFQHIHSNSSVWLLNDCSVTVVPYEDWEWWRWTERLSLFSLATGMSGASSIQWLTAQCWLDCWWKMFWSLQTLACRHQPQIGFCLFTVACLKPPCGGSVLPAAGNTVNKVYSHSLWNCQSCTELILLISRHWLALDHNEQTSHYKLAKYNKL